jgi:uncharacterized protein YdeI (BOF family)
MKKLVFLLLVGTLLVSGALFAQTTQPAGVQNQQGQQNQLGNQGDNFARGGYIGPVLEIITIADLVNTAPNEFVIVEGYLILQRVPGTFVLADSIENPTTSVIVRLNTYSWSNLDITNDTPVLIYGTVNRSELRIEIEGIRVETHRLP